MSLTAIKCISYGQIFPLFCGVFTRNQVQRSITIGAYMATHNKTQKRFGAATNICPKQKGILTWDRGILGELPHNFANFGGDECIARKRQTVRNLRRHSSLNGTAGQRMITDYESSTGI